MLQSHVIEIGGIFVGAAITTTTGFRFRAVHSNVKDLDESTWRSLKDLNRAVQHLFTTGQLNAGRDSDSSNPRTTDYSPLFTPASGAPSWLPS